MLAYLVGALLLSLKIIIFLCAALGMLRFRSFLPFGVIFLVFFIIPLLIAKTPIYFRSIWVELFALLLVWGVIEVVAYASAVRK